MNKTMKTSDFDYILPENLIAQTPVYPRDTSGFWYIIEKTIKSNTNTFMIL